MVYWLRQSILRVQVIPLRFSRTDTSVLLTRSPSQRRYVDLNGLQAESLVSAQDHQYPIYICRNQCVHSTLTEGFKRPHLHKKVYTKTFTLWTYTFIFVCVSRKTTVKTYKRKSIPKRITTRIHISAQGRLRVNAGKRTKRIRLLFQTFSCKWGLKHARTQALKDMRVDMWKASKRQFKQTIDFHCLYSNWQT